MTGRASVIMVLLLPWVLQSGNGVCETFLTLMALNYLLIRWQKSWDNLLDGSNLLGISMLFVTYLMINGLLVGGNLKSVLAGLGMLRFILAGLLVKYVLQNNPDAVKWLFLSCCGALLWIVLNSYLQLALGHDVFGNEVLQFGTFIRLVTTAGKPRIGYSAAVLSIVVIGFILNIVSGCVDKNKKASDMILGSNLHFICKLIATILVALSGIVVVVVSGERTALLLLLLTMVIYAVLERQFTFKVKILALITMLCTVNVIIFFSDSSIYYRMVELTAVQLQALDQDGYGYIYKAAWNLWLEHPLFGIGTNNFFDVCTQWLPHHPEWKARCGKHPHNIYLQVLLEGGIVGFFCLLSMFGCLFRHITKTVRNDYTLIATSCLLARAFPLLPSSNFYHAYFVLPMVLMLGLALLRDNAGADVRRANTR